MKKWLVSAAILATLTACSTSNESKQQANDNFAKKETENPVFFVLESGGVNLPAQSSTYRLPQASITKGQPVDIRPPTSPVALISNSLAQFDGERALIVYPLPLKDVYSIRQVARLLTEQGIQFNQQGNQIVTDWASTGRLDDVGDVQIRYQIEHVATKEAAALAVHISEMKRDGVVFTPSLLEKQRYSSEKLNQLAGELNFAYRQQQQDLASTGYSSMQSVITTDTNGRMALALAVGFNQAWQPVGNALERIGFDTKEENAGRGSRKLKYSPLDLEEWSRFSTVDPQLEKGVYFMQLVAMGNQSAVVISDEEGNALSGTQGEAIYQALQNILGR